MSDEKVEIHYHIYGDVVGREKLAANDPDYAEKKAQRDAERAREAAEEAAEAALEAKLEAEAAEAEAVEFDPTYDTGVRVKVYNRSGGVNFNLGGGTLNVGGKIVAGDSRD